MKTTLALLTALLVPLVEILAEDTSARKPNIVFILVDDVGRDWVSCYGAKQPTPNIDRLAREGICFQTAWATPLCTPTRVEALTGQYPFRTGWTVHHDVPARGGDGLNPGRYTTIARVLRDAGYATALCGKWQINDLRKDPDILAKHGFQKHCLWPSGEAGNPPSENRYWDAYIQTDGQRQIQTGKFGPDVVHEYAKAFVEQHQGGPFFLYYPMICCHAPIALTPAQKAAGIRSGKEGAQVLSGMMTYVDAQVGDLMDHLAELGLADRTLVVFAGDNGSARPGVVDEQLLSTGKKSKGHTFDVSVHVPFVVRAPFLIKKPGVSEALVDFTDLFPTFAALAGTSAPQGWTLDGHSLVPILTGDSNGSRAWVYSQLKRSRVVRDQRFKLDGYGDLFNLRADPLEKNNLRDSKAVDATEARRRLAGILESLPADAPAPFEDYRGQAKKQKKAALK